MMLAASAPPVGRQRCLALLQMCFMRETVRLRTHG